MNANSNIKLLTGAEGLELIHWWDITEDERREFYYMREPEIDFIGFKYNDTVYSLNDFMRIKPHGSIPGWDGVMTECNTSALLLKFINDNEAVMLARIF